ncbi:MAG: glycosyltransferase family 2 protein [Alphaproteobacteria bacterium]|nr:glycosyltransferase family 2 protein [Alphaproteobacteria bacterium]
MNSEVKTIASLESIEISIVCPVYNAEDCIEELYQRLTLTLSKISLNYEMVFVEDRGRDNSWELIRTLALQDKKIKAIRLSKNFGQHRAITAGLAHAQGENIVVMDCDLQDTPEDIESLYKKIQEGHDMVVGRRSKRKDTFLKKTISRFFYKFYSFCVGVEMDHTIANFGIYSRKVINSFLKLKEQHRFFPISIKWCGFNCTSIDITHSKRFKGKSSYTLYKLLKCGVDNIISNSSLPLLLICETGVVLSFFSFLYGNYIILRWIFLGTLIPGWASLMVFLSFIGGIVILSIGLVGLYIRKIFEEVKERPLYIIDEAINT